MSHDRDSITQDLGGGVGSPLAVGTKSQVETRLHELKSEVLSYRRQIRLRKKRRLRVSFSLDLVAMKKRLRKTFL
jgi:hypothetical protein